MLKKIKETQAGGNIAFDPKLTCTRKLGVLKKSGKIKLNPQIANDPNYVAIVLVHEATHAVDGEENPKAKNPHSIDEELRANSNELDLYGEFKGYTNPEMEGRAKARASGPNGLREDVRSRYGTGYPETRG